MEHEVYATKADLAKVEGDIKVIEGKVDSGNRLMESIDRRLQEVPGKPNGQLIAYIFFGTLTALISSGTFAASIVWYVSSAIESKVAPVANDLKAVSSLLRDNVDQVTTNKTQLANQTVTINGMKDDINKLENTDVVARLSAVETEMKAVREDGEKRENQLDDHARLFGHPAEMEAISNLKSEFNLLRESLTDRDALQRIAKLEARLDAITPHP